MRNLACLPNRSTVSEICPSSNTRVDGATCLGDVLGARAYRTVFMTGVDIHFGGIETFHAAHGLVERLGFEALSPLAGIDTGRLPNRHWLIEDEMLFALARAKVHELAEEAEPFALAMNTADTHGSGFPPQAARAPTACSQPCVARTGSSRRSLGTFAPPTRTSWWRC